MMLLERIRCSDLPDEGKNLSKLSTTNVLSFDFESTVLSSAYRFPQDETGQDTLSCVSEAIRVSVVMGKTCELTFEFYLLAR